MSQRFSIAILALLLCSGPFGYTQKLNVDSLTHLLQTERGDKARFKTLLRLALEYKRIDFSKSLQYADEAIALAQENDWPAWEIDAHSIKASVLIFTDIDSAQRLTEHLLTLFLREKDTIGQLDSYNRLGQIYHRKDSLNKALFVMEKSLALTEKNPRDRARTLVNIGFLHNERQDFKQTVESFFAALEMLEKEQDFQGLGAVNNNIGIVYSDQRDLENALVYFQRSLEAYEQTNDQLKAYSVRNHIGHTYVDLEKYTEAEETYQELLRLSQETDQTEWIIKAKCGLANLYVNDLSDLAQIAKAKAIVNELNQKEAEMQERDLRDFLRVKSLIHQAEQNYPMAIAYLSRVLELDQQGGLSYAGVEEIERMAELYAQIGDSRNAYRYHTLFKAKNDSVISQEKLAGLKVKEAELEYQQEKELTEERFRSEQALAAQKIRFRNYFTLSLFLALLLTIGWGFAVYRSHQKGKEYAELLEREVQQRTQELKKTNKNLEQANYELRTFTYIASHNIKEPIRGIGSQVGLVYKQLTEELQQELQANFDFINGSAQQLYRLLADFSRYSSMAQYRDLKRERVDLNKLITQIIERAHQERLPYKGQVKVAALPVIQSNEFLLYASLKNLIENGLKFNESQVPTVKVSYQETAERHQLIVADNGIGIDPPYREQVFEMLNRLNRQSEYEGSGIGLAIVKLSVEKLEGTVWVEASETGGSKFIISLPKYETQKVFPANEVFPQIQG